MKSKCKIPKDEGNKKTMRMIISSRCFAKNTIKQNTMKIRVEYKKFYMKKQASAKNVKMLQI